VDARLSDASGTLMLLWCHSQDDSLVYAPTVPEPCRVKSRRNVVRPAQEGGPTRWVRLLAPGVFV